MPYVDINAKCTMGYEGWNGSTIVLEDENGSDDEGSDPEGEAAIAQLETCNQELGVLQSNEVDAAVAVQVAEDNLVAAVQDYYTQTKELNDCYESGTNVTYCSSQRSSANSADSNLDGAVANQTAKQNTYNGNPNQANADALAAANDDVASKRDILEARVNSWRSCLLSGFPAKPSGCGGKKTDMNTARTLVTTRKNELAQAKIDHQLAEAARKAKATECEGYSDAATGGHSF